MNTKLKEMAEEYQKLYLNCLPRSPLDRLAADIFDAIADRLPEDAGPESTPYMPKVQNLQSPQTVHAGDAYQFTEVHPPPTHKATWTKCGAAPVCGRMSQYDYLTTTDNRVTCLDCLKLMKPTEAIRPIHIWRTGEFTLCQTSLVDCAGVVTDMRHSTCERCIELDK